MEGEIEGLKILEQDNLTMSIFRSILTVPWIELGGNVTITCPKTGYRAEIDFLTKPFYGGKKNKIAGEVIALKHI
jgi:hypothetical protein